MRQSVVFVIKTFVNPVLQKMFIKFVVFTEYCLDCYNFFDLNIK